MVELVPSCHPLQINGVTLWASDTITGREEYYIIPLFLMMGAMNDAADVSHGHKFVFAVAYFFKLLRIRKHVKNFSFVKNKDSFVVYDIKDNNNYLMVRKEENR